MATAPLFYPSLLVGYGRVLRDLSPRPLLLVDGGRAAEVAAHLAAHGADGVYEIVEDYAPQAPDLLLKLEEVRYPRTIRTAARGTGPLPPPVWTIGGEADLYRAASTLERDASYALARRLVIPVAARLARALHPTRISPNTVTAWSCTAGVLAACLIVWPGTLAARIAAAALIHTSITLDFTDGYLARLRGVESSFGWWFDTLLDEVVKFSLFAALAGSLLRAGDPWWMIAIAAQVLLMYHVLTCNQWLLQSLQAGDPTRSEERMPRAAEFTPRGIARAVFDRMVQLDVLLYLIAAAVLLRLERPLLALYALNYTLRFVLLLRHRFRERAARALAS